MPLRNYLCAFLLLSFLYSCVGAKKMREVSAKLQNLESLNAGEVGKARVIGSESMTKLSERKIDSNINSRITERLTIIHINTDSIGKEIASLKTLTVDKKTFRKNYKKHILPRLAQLDTFYNKYDSRVRIYLMMEDGLNMSNYVLFDLAAFFGPGLYSIPEDKAELASRSFQPLIDSLVKFSNKYQDIPRTATLVILGFADGQDINRSGVLYDTLASKLGKVDASKEELNKKLSELRALELISHLTNIFMQKVPQIKNLDELSVEYIGQGKGEQFPMPTIKDYQENDERRRVVLCYWAVLPNIK